LDKNSRTLDGTARGRGAIQRPAPETAESRQNFELRQPGLIKIIQYRDAAAGLAALGDRKGRACEPIWTRGALHERKVSLQSIRVVDARGGHGPNMSNAVVLVVEDEALIRMSAVQMVEDAGFAVLEACNADEAIKLLVSRHDIRAVFTDINMSGSSMDGWKLAHAIRGRWPPIHLIVTSGLCTPEEGQLPAKGLFIRKPYSAEQVTAALWKLFDHNPDMHNGYSRVA
jgi:CheY-like chemotaxis protein